MAQGLVLILLVAGVLAVMMHRLKIATIPAYLIGGAIFGSLGLYSSDAVTEIGGLAIIFLMFGIGLTLDVSVIRGGWRTAVFATAISIVIIVSALWPLLRWLGVDPRGALILAVAFSNSSTAITMRLMQQRRQIARTRGRLSVMLLVGQDISMIGVLVMLPIIASMGAPAEVAAAAPKMTLGMVVRTVGLGLAGLAGIFVVGRFVLPRFLSEAARMHSGEVLMVLSIAFSVGASVTTKSLGMSPELGAFIAGLLLSNTNFRHHLAGQIGTLRDLFIAVFFTTLGMKVDLAEIAANWPMILLVSAAVIAAKSIGIGLACWFTGAAMVTAMNVGIMLAQGSEFGLVLMDLASRGDYPILDKPTIARCTAVIVVTMTVTPLLFELAAKLPRNASMRRTAPWYPAPSQSTMPDSDDGPTPPDAPRGFPVDTMDEAVSTKRHVIVAGFGLVGRAVTDRLRPTGAEVMIVELNPKTVRDQQAKGRSIIYGDVANPEVLETAGIHHADALILTVPDEEAVLAACKTARQMNPSIFIVARTNVVSKGFLAKGLGADVAVIEELAAAESMERIITQRLRVWKKEDFPDATMTIDGPAQT